jgi:hypothetical protein
MDKTRSRPLDARFIRPSLGRRTALLALTVLTSATVAFAQQPQDGGEGRSRLREELSRIREQSGPKPRGVTVPPLPTRRPADRGRGEAAAQQPTAPATLATPLPSTEKLAGDLLILGFSGTEPNDAGVKAAKALLHQSQIAGVFVREENVVSRPQLRELMKALVQGKPKPALIAIGDPSGNSGPLVYDKGFDPWPNQAEVMEKADPNTAYTTYRTLGTNLDALGFNLVFGPRIATSEAEKADPLKRAVFAKTYILGQTEAEVVAVPVVDGTDISFRTLKSLLVSYPKLAVAAASPTGSGWPQVMTSPLLTGPRFCFVDPNAMDTAVQRIGKECDMFVVGKAGDKADAVRQRFVTALSAYLKSGAVAASQVTETVTRVKGLRAGS